MNIAISVARYVKVDYQCGLGDIETSSGNIGSNKYAGC
jgi:hypothetical protein